MNVITKLTVFILLFTGCFYANSQNKKVDNPSHNLKGFLSSGTFVIGTNYWASHAGPEMWSDWRPDIVEQDFKKLSEAGIKALRVFPLWPEFQPITAHRAFKGEIVEYRFGEDPLPDTKAGEAGVDINAISKFKTFVSLAEKYDIKLVVSLLTGWMSGRLYVSPALDGLNLLTDAEAVKWEVRYVRYMVSEFKDSPSIVAWDLGNECECMAPVASSSEAWTWVATITDAIKVVDNSRPVIAGTGTRISSHGGWNMKDLSENTDVLTTHFYHTFTPFTEKEPLNTIRPVLAPVVENLVKEDMTGKPCFIEEMGTLGPFYGTDSEKGVKPGFIRSNLFSLWAHNAKALFWWVAFEQGHLTQTPFDWNSRGSEYGLWYADGSKKPVLYEMQKFTSFLSDFGEPLSKRIIDGVCLLSNGQDQWSISLSTYLLAKQAGLDIEFQLASQPIKDSKLYFLPSVNGSSVIPRRRMQELLKKVQQGATLYISNEDGHIGPHFTDVTGVSVLHYQKQSVNDKIYFEEQKFELPIMSRKETVLKVETAKVLAVNQNGDPAFVCNNYGDGKIFYLNYPLEKYVTSKSGVFDSSAQSAYWKIYDSLKEEAISSKAVLTRNSKIGFTEHIVDENTRVIVAVNYFPSEEYIDIELSNGWKIEKAYYGKYKKNRLIMHANDAVVLSISKNSSK